MIKKRFGIKRQLSAAAAVCMLIQPAAVIAQDTVVQDTVINEEVSDGWLESSKQALLTDSETGTLSPNYLSGLNPKSFSPTIGKDNEGYSQSKDPESLRMTDGIKNQQWQVWFVKFPSKAKKRDKNYPFVSYKLDSQQSVNTVKIFAGRDAEELNKINEKLKSDKISVFVKESADWKEVKINTSEEYDTKNKCQLVTIRFAPEKASEIKLEFQEGTGIVGDQEPNNIEGFRIREIELYNDSTYVPEPEPSFAANIKTTVSKQGAQTTFAVSAKNIPQSSTVILALYQDGQLLDMQHAVCENGQIIFTTTVKYDIAKVMAWDNLDTMTPVCKADIQPAE